MGVRELQRGLVVSECRSRPKIRDSVSQVPGKIVERTSYDQKVDVGGLHVGGPGGQTQVAARQAGVGAEEHRLAECVSHAAGPFRSGRERFERERFVRQNSRGRFDRFQCPALGDVHQGELRQGVGGRVASAR